MTTYFTNDHEYIKVEGDTGTVGITTYAQQALGDVVYVELPKTGTAVKKGAAAAVVESVKSANEVYAPVTGTVTEVNTALADNPALVNQDAEGAAWFYKIKIADSAELSGLKSADAYQAYTKGL